MKRLLVAVAVLSSVVMGGLLYPVSAAAVNVFPSACTDQSDPQYRAIHNSSVCQDAQAQSQNNTNPLFGPSGIITVIIKIVAIVVGFLAIIMIIAAGLKMILAGGDAADVKEARASLAHALVALAVAVLAQAIVGFVLSKIS